MIWVIFGAAAICAILSLVYIACVGWWIDNFVAVYVLGSLYLGFVLWGVFLIGSEGFHADYAYKFRPALYIFQFVAMMLFIGGRLFITGELMRTFSFPRLNCRNLLEHIDGCLAVIVLILVVTIGLSFVPKFVTANEKIERWCLDAVTEESVEDEICGGIRQKFTNNTIAEHVWNGFRDHPDSDPALDSIVDAACLGNRDSDAHIKVLDDLRETAKEHYVEWDFAATVRDVQEVCPLYRKNLVDVLTKTFELNHI